MTEQQVLLLVGAVVGSILVVAALLHQRARQRAAEKRNVLDSLGFVPCEAMDPDGAARVQALAIRGPVPTDLRFGSGPSAIHYREVHEKQRGRARLTVFDFDERTGRANRAGRECVLLRSPGLEAPRLRLFPRIQAPGFVAATLEALLAKAEALHGLEQVRLGAEHPLAARFRVSARAADEAARLLARASLDALPTTVQLEVAGDAIVVQPLPAGRRPVGDVLREAIAAAEALESALKG